MKAALALAVAAAVGCHTISSVEDTVAIDPIARAMDSSRKLLPPAVEVTTDGKLEFVRPQICRMQVYKRTRTYEERTSKPNLATVIVGLVLASVGTVVTATGIATDDTLSTVGGGAAVVAGVPLIALPYIGTKTERVEKSVNEFRAHERTERCGQVPSNATRAVVTFQDVRVAGQIDAEGVFTIPLFHFIDAFAYRESRGPASAILDGTDSVDWILDGEQLAPAVDGFFRSLQIDSSIERLEAVPKLSGDHFAVVLDRGDPYPIALVSVTIRNDGPGTAWGVRARLDSAVPELRSRYLYIGRLGPGKTADPVLAIPLADPTIDLRTANLQLEILDAHQTAPTVPLSQPRILVNP